MLKVCSCLKNELLREYKKIITRHDRTITKNDRLRSLAEPKTYTHHYHRPATPSIRSKSSIIKIDVQHLEGPRKSRLEQLSLPRVRNMTALCGQQCYEKLSNDRKETISRTLRKSFLSMYSRFSNVENPFPKKEVSKLTPEKRRENQERMIQLARPVKPKIPIEFEKPSSEGEKPSLYRYKKLSKPRIYPSEPPPIEWRLTAKMRDFQPTPRLTRLAIPAERYRSIIDEKLYRRSSTTLKDTDNRFLSLSKPRLTNQSTLERNEEISAITPKALTAIPSKRILELAKPRNYNKDFNTRKGPAKDIPRVHFA